MPNTKPINILLADDDPDDRFFFASALKKISIATRLHTVEDGELLMNYFSEKKGNLPDVLFLDVNMPRKNGLECLIEIKANKTLKDLPVIIYSTFRNDNVADMYYDKGAHRFMRKCDFPELVIRLNQVLTMLKENSLLRETKDKFILSMNKP